MDTRTDAQEAPRQHHPGCEERRQNCRIDVPVALWVEVPLALSYETIDLSAEEWNQWHWDDLAVPPDLVHAMVDENDFVIRDPLLMQMVARIDWMLTSIMRTLGKEEKFKQALPEFTTVNLSGSGIRFMSDHAFAVDSHLRLRLVLRPFIPIQAIAKVLRAELASTGEGAVYHVAAEFVRIAPDDREAIIRHILRTQASMQRHRLHDQTPSSVV